jgi:hypothetical protein
MPDISRKHTVSVFRVEVVVLGSRGIYMRLEEGKAGGVGLSVQSGSTARVVSCI